jgi:hypothetical protein
LPVIFFSRTTFLEFDEYFHNCYLLVILLLFYLHHVIFTPVVEVLYGLYVTQSHVEADIDFTAKNIKVVIALGIHLFPFRTEKLSPIAPMVLQICGRVGSRRLLLKSPFNLV